MVSVAEVGDGLEHVSKHCVGGLGGEDRVLKQDQQSTNIVLPEIYPMIILEDSTIARPSG